MQTPRDLADYTCSTALLFIAREGFSNNFKTPKVPSLCGETLSWESGSPSQPS